MLTLSSLPVLGGQIVEGLGIHIARALEGIVQVAEYEVGEKQKHGRDSDCDESERQIVKRKEEQEKRNRAGRDGHEKKKRTRNPLYAEGEPFIAVSAGLVRNFQQTLVDPLLRFIFRLDLGEAGQDSREQLISPVSVLPLGERSPFRFNHSPSIGANGPDDGIARLL